jgi:hypothetical protein
MKVCEVCGLEFGGLDGDNVCSDCRAKSAAKRAKAKQRRRGIEAAYESCGLVKVRGALGGTYWE